MTLDQMQELNAAIERHGAGDLDQAEAAYRRILEVNPDHPVALHLLGVIALQVGRPAVAIDLIGKALTRLPSYADAHFNLGNALLATDRAEEAAASYRKAIEYRPDHASAHYNLGTVLKDLGRPEDAVASYRAAIRHDPLLDQAHGNLGMVLQALGRLEEAVQIYTDALSLNPALVEARNNLGNALKHLGRLEEAESSYRAALESSPSHPEAHYNLAVLLRETGRLDEAIGGFKAALAAKPDYAQAHYSLGIAFQELGELDAAVDSYRAAIKYRQDHAEAHYNLGTALRELDQTEIALDHYRAAILARPGHAEARNNLGAALQELGHLAAAIEAYRPALLWDPGSADILNNLGTALRGVGRLAEALASGARALVISPEYTTALNNMGIALHESRRYGAAIEHYRKVLARQPTHAAALLNLGFSQYETGDVEDAVISYRESLRHDPDFAPAYSNLGVALQDQSDLDGAIAAYRQALALDPDYANAHGNLLFCLNYHPDLSAETIFDAYREFDENFCLPLRSYWADHDNDRDPDRGLKIGYVGPTFYEHSSLHFVEPLLANHDKSRVELHAYAELTREDAVTDRYKGYFDRWTSTRGITDAELVARIRDDGIDVLVDIASHTKHNRLGVFARKPAPVSVHWLDFGYTTGLSAIDYYLGDAITSPPGAEALFAETPWRLPRFFLPYRPADGMGEPSPSPASRNGFVTFGALARSIRINHRTIRVWSQVLNMVPNSRLVLDSRNFRGQDTRQSVRDAFAEHGVEPARLHLGFNSPPWDVLREIDIAFDCFPHNSGTTLFEHLYMGMPFVTLAGRPSVGRLGQGILQEVGHPEWVAETEDEYVEIAARLAADTDGLAILRDRLRDDLKACRLMDEAGFASDVEDAYRQMWRIWCEAG